jgi:hypothetical protein
MTNPGRAYARRKAWNGSARSQFDRIEGRCRSAEDGLRSAGRGAGSRGDPSTAGAASVHSGRAASNGSTAAATTGIAAAARIAAATGIASIAGIAAATGITTAAGIAAATGIASIAGIAAATGITTAAGIAATAAARIINPASRQCDGWRAHRGREKQRHGRRHNDGELPRRFEKPTPSFVSNAVGPVDQVRCPHLSDAHARYPA